MTQPIGIFDSGYGGLTVFRNIRDTLPEHDFLYLGDNARAPYGSRSFESIHEYTWQCLQWMLGQGCPLIIVACNTSSAKALRSIQQNDLPNAFPDRRVLGVIRPTAELIGTFSHTQHVGILGTNGTITSNSYPLEISKFYPGLKVYQQACPLWVPLVEAGEQDSLAAEIIVSQNIDELLSQSTEIDTVLLACTHYPLLAPQILQKLPANIRLVMQGQIVADSLKDYLKRHTEMSKRLSHGGTLQFFTTDRLIDFEQKASLFFKENVSAQQIHL